MVYIEIGAGIAWETKFNFSVCKLDTPSFIQVRDAQNNSKAEMLIDWVAQPKYKKLRQINGLFLAGFWRIFNKRLSRSAPADEIHTCILCICIYTHIYYIYASIYVHACTDQCIYITEDNIIYIYIHGISSADAAQSFKAPFLIPEVGSSNPHTALWLSTCKAGDKTADSAWLRPVSVDAEEIMRSVCVAAYRVTGDTT